MSNIPYGRQHITEEDIAAVVEVLRGDYLTQGPAIPAFEQAFAHYVGAQFAVAVSNGTAALHLSALAMNLQQGQKVITTPITFAATANCIRYCGGEVVFADIDPETYLLDLNEVRKLLEASPRGTYSGIIPVDFAGRAVNLEKFRELADEFGLWMIEDSCHAPGGFFIDSNGERQHCGNGQFAECAIFSFHPVKHIAAGEGGMITTNDPALYERLLRLRSHGITRDAMRFKNSLSLAYGSAHSPAEYPWWYMEMEELGYNYRLTDIQAALGLSQLQRAVEGINSRHAIAARYNDAFQNEPNIIDRNVESGRTSGHGHAHHLYVIEVIGHRNELYTHLREHQIYAQIHYVPAHLMPYYRAQGWSPGDLPSAESYYAACISLPIYPSMSSQDLQKVLDSIRSFFEQSED